MLTADIVDNDQSQVSRAEYTRVAQSDSWEDQSEDSEGGGDQQGEHNSVVYIFCQIPCNKLTTMRGRGRLLLYCAIDIEVP